MPFDNCWRELNTGLPQPCPVSRKRDFGHLGESWQLTLISFYVCCLTIVARVGKVPGRISCCAARAWQVWITLEGERRSKMGIVHTITFNPIHHIRRIGYKSVLIASCGLSRVQQTHVALSWFKFQVSAQRLISAIFNKYNHFCGHSSGHTDDEDEPNQDSLGPSCPSDLRSRWS